MFLKKRTLVAFMVLFIMFIGTLLFLMFSPIPAPQQAMEQELDAKELVSD